MLNSKYKLYGRKKSFSLNEFSQDLLDNFLPKFHIDPFKLQDNFSYLKSKVNNFFINQPQNTHKEIFLEIGFGGGEHVYNLAKTNPQVLIIAIEPYINGVISLLKKIKNHPIENILILNANAQILLDTLPENYLNRIYILFPDPWHKKRHHKRRIINSHNIAIFAKAIQSNGFIRCATDHLDYANWIIYYINQNSIFNKGIKDLQDYITTPEDHFQTRYELKALKRNSICYYMDFYCLK